MRWRLLRCCLLFALLGLVTAVGVAWGVAVRWQAGKGVATSVTIGAGIIGDRPLMLTARGGLAIDIEEWEVRPALPVAGPFNSGVNRALTDHYRRMTVMRSERRDPVSVRRLIDDDRTALGPPASRADLAPGRAAITRLDAGWPLRALRCTVEHSGIHTPTALRANPAPLDPETTTRGAIEVVWLEGAAAARPPALRAPYLPIEPRPGLLLNTIFYALLWAMLLLGPGALRRRIRRGRGLCPRCGYSLRGQPAAGCPECGDGRAAPAAAFLMAWPLRARG